MADRAGASEAAFQKMADTADFEMKRLQAGSKELMRDVGAPLLFGLKETWRVLLQMGADINDLRKGETDLQRARNAAWEEGERRIRRHVAALGELKAVQAAMTHPAYQQIDLADRLAAAQKRVAETARMISPIAATVEQAVAGRFDDMTVAAQKAAEAIDQAFLDPLKKAAKAVEAIETKRIDDFATALEKVLQEQIKVSREMAVATGVYSEVDARLDAIMETLNLTADEAAVLRGELQKIFDMTAAGKDVALPWVQWPERIMEDLETETDAWLAQVNAGLGEITPRAGRTAAMEQRFLQRAPGTDPMLVEAKKADGRRQKQVSLLEKLVAATEKPAATLPWAPANLTGAGGLPWKN